MNHCYILIAKHKFVHMPCRWGIISLSVYSGVPGRGGGGGESWAKKKTQPKAKKGHQQIRLIQSLVTSKDTSLGLGQNLIKSIEDANDYNVRFKRPPSPLFLGNSSLAKDSPHAFTIWFRICILLTIASRCVT